MTSDYQAARRTGAAVLGVVAIVVAIIIEVYRARTTDPLVDRLEVKQ